MTLAQFGTELKRAVGRVLLLILLLQPTGLSILMACMYLKHGTWSVPLPEQVLNTKYIGIIWLVWPARFTYKLLAAKRKGVDPLRFAYLFGISYW